MISPPRKIKSFFFLSFLLALDSVWCESRNLVLITIDTIRGDYLSYNGSTSVQTPNLDGLAKRGVNFTRARTAVPLTLPSHSSIMTGLNPPMHEVRENGRYKLADTHVTLAEVLKKQNYTTAAFIGSFVLDHRFGLAQGFDTYDDRTWSEAAQMEKLDTERNAGSVFKAFSAWFEKVNATKPFFVWIHLFDPHIPYSPPVQYRNRYPQNPYAGEVAYTDSVIGEILKKLEVRNALEKSIVAVVGDHGESLGEHQENTHSVLIYNSTLHVPMMIVAPKLISPGIQISKISRTIDLAPTLLDYLGVKSSLGEGSSLRNLIENKPTKEIVAYSESLYPKINLGWSELHGLENENYHFILAPKPELYDVNADPKEKNNKIAQLPKVAQQLSQKLQDYINKGQFTSPETIDPETREKLESLGYISAPSSKPQLKISSAVDPKEKMAVWNQIQDGIGQFSNGDFNAAARTFEKILASEKDLLIAYDYLGSSYIQLKQWSQAERVFRQSLARNIEWSGLRMKLGQILYEREEFAQAQKELEKSIALDRLNVSSYYYLGNVFRSQGNFLKAIENYERALKINPDYVYAKTGIGMSYAMMKKDEEAVKAFQDAIRIDPNGAPHYFNLAIGLERLKRFPEATDAYRKFLKLSDAKEFPHERQKANEAIRKISGEK